MVFDFAIALKHFGALVSEKKHSAAGALRNARDGERLQNNLATWRGAFGWQSMIFQRAGALLRESVDHENSAQVALSGANLTLENVNYALS